MTPEDIENRFIYHPPVTDEKKAAHEIVRAKCFELACHLNWQLPEGREKSLAITNLEQVQFWSNASIARPKVEVTFK